MRPKFVLPLIIIALCGLGVGTAAAQEPHPAKLVWSDEFSGPAGTTPDSSKWKFDVGAGGWGNHELETYCAPHSDAAPCSSAAANAFLDGDGHLVIRAIRTGASWTSARLLTSGIEEPAYGRIEARLKMEQGPGVWPAFWLLGADAKGAGWPACGEIDIMEHVPELGPRTIASTLHGPVSGGKGVSSRFTLGPHQSVDSAFHTYGAIWSPDQIAFYVDDAAHPFVVNTKAKLRSDWVYDHPFYILLNLAIGGDWPGDPDAATPPVVNLLVDYVRVYGSGS